jgi:hypothetical protein
METELRVLLVISSLIMFFFIIKKIRKSKIRIDESIFWIISSLLFLGMAIFPGIIIALSKLVGIESPVNLVFLIVVGIVFLKSFFTSIHLSAQLEKHAQLTQYVALLEKELHERKG